ncbi:N-acetylmuramoyl-L-alanine amidase [Jeotgalibacillus proteolyticus]|uniref:N-acetylmuramoyl-L-alanine amidase n=1 Tax=Jeotgalibacillus proteolyticus TaxID=2082395 RepID=A0A2S5GB86_9BACL|nr:N-acetylmuramoyl-L-alanine amidase [Jeotgalibacillus proteolyticus]PPA70282.1 N-acetylmuramoyl-L-alanine amidase [Jeotgalibacillus proteolyticus]
MKNVFHKVLLFLTVSVLVFSSLGTAQVSASTPFTDVSSSDKEIIYLYERGFINGTSKTTYSPAAPVTREQAATMIGRALGYDGAPTKTSFPDVKANGYSSGYIQEAVKNGIITGDSDGTFRPLDTMTRGEMAFLLSRAFNLLKTSSVYFTDVKVNTNANSQYTAINKIATFGITNGTGGGKYSPNLAVNRKDFAAFVARGLNPDFRVVFQNAKIEEMTVTTNDLNVRKGPGTNHASIGKVHTGAKVEVYGYNGTWVYGKSGNLTGYISMDYLAKAGEVKRIVVIDPGHGGNDPGAVANGLQEKDVNLDVSKRINTLLQGKGISVLMTRTTDVFISLDDRASFGVRNGADAFVSIHANAAGSSVSGSETFYSASTDQRSADSKQLATFIQNRLYKAMDHPNRGVKDAQFRVINSNPLPAALVELGFLTNSSDAQKLASNTYKDRAAKAVADGIEDYYNWKQSR